jgi:AcrR family transcriptional regulator
MRSRSRTAAATWSRIVHAAHRLLNRRDATTLTLHQVAQAARVSRATIYKSVGSRRKLLAAVFEDQGRLIHFDRVLAAARLEDPARAILATVRESCRAWSVMPLAIRKTLALAALDAEIGKLVERYEQYRRQEITMLARRAHGAGVINAGLTVQNAATTLALVTSFHAFDHLRLLLDAPAATRHLVHLTTEALGLTPDHES